MKNGTRKMTIITAVAAIAFLAAANTRLKAEETNASTVDDETLFLATYDTSLDADFAKGRKETISGSGELKDGSLVAKGNAFKPIGYSAAGNISPDVGTIEFILRPEFSLNKPPALTIYRLFKAKGFAIGVNNAKNRNYLWFLRQDREYGPKDHGVYVISPLEKDVRHHVAIEWNPDFMAVFLDGQLLKKTANRGPLNVGDAFLIGGGKKPYNADSLIDSVRISKNCRFPLDSKKKMTPAVKSPEINAKPTLKPNKPRVVFSESFNDEGPKKWESSSQFCLAEVALSPRAPKDKCLRMAKKDTTGYCLIKFANIKVKSGVQLRLSADLLTERIEPYASFATIVKQFNGQKLVETKSFPFNDVSSRQSAFGGRHKTPVTMGDWRRTQHVFQTAPGVTSLEIDVVLSQGRQTLLLDDVTLEEIAGDAQASAPNTVYEKTIDETHAELELDALIPGCVYEVKASYSSPKVSNGGQSDGAPGMGIAMTALDESGNKLSKEELIEKRHENGEKTFLMRVPGNAFSVILSLHNSDMLNLNWAQCQKQAKKWDKISVNLVSLGEIVMDNALNQYVYLARPGLKPRGLMEPTPYDIQVIDERLRTAPDSYCELKKLNGGMCFEIDGKAVPPFMATSHPNNHNLDVYSQLTKNGVDVLNVFEPYGGASCGGFWNGENDYDFSGVDDKIYETLCVNPDAKIILSAGSLYAPDWWSERNPDELAKDQNGLFCWADGPTLYKTTYGAMDELVEHRQKLKKNSRHMKKGAKSPGHFVQSTASRKYVRAISDYLTALRRHIESKPYGKAVIGYRLHWGYDTQWGKVKNQHGYGGPVHYLDYSGPMLERFKKYLENKYETVEKLRKAWGDNQVAFESVSIPGIERRNLDVMEAGTYFLNPAEDQAIIDYRQCETSTVGEMLAAWSKAIKKAGKKEVLTLAYYPDISDSCTGGPARQRGHHVVMAEDSGWDGGGGPSYQARNVGLGGVSNCMLSSFPLHDKIHMCEMDFRLFPVVKRRYCNNVVFDSPKKSLSVLRREFAKEMCFGTGGWSYDMGAGWFNDPMVAKMVGECLNVFRSVLDKKRDSIAKAAMFIGEYGKTVQGDGRRGVIPKTIVCGAKATAMHAGFPIDQYQLRDLPLVKDKYKVFHFPFAYAFTDEETKWIDELKKNGNTLIFGYGAGYAGNSLSIENVEKLTGFKLGEDPAQSLTVKLTDAEFHGEKLAGFVGNGTDNNLTTGLPRFFIDDPEATTLGTFPENNHAGIAVKDHGDWRSVYIGAVGLIPPELLRAIARQANIHVYNAENDVMFFCENLIAIHASSTGEKTIRLPKKAYVTSLWDDQKLGPCDQIARTMKLGENALYLIESTNP